MPLFGSIPANQNVEVDPVWVQPGAPSSPDSGELWWDTDEVAMGTTLPLGVTDGGTGATSPATARASLAVPAIGNSTTTAGAPTTGTWARGDQWLDSANVVWTCVTAGTPGVWRAQMGSVTTSLRVYGPFSVSTPSISPNTEATSTAYAHGLGVVPTLVLAEAEDGSFAAWCSFRVVRDATNISFTVANKHSSQPAAAVIRFLIFV